MTVNVLPLDVGYRTVDVAHMVNVAQKHTQIWEEEDFDALPLVQENLGRYKGLLSRCLDQTIVTAQQLEAHLAPHIFNEIIQVWMPEDSGDLLEMAEQARQKILVQLGSQITYLQSESKALSSLPEIYGTTDRARLYQTLISRAAHADIRTEMAERLEADLQKVLRALDTLETSRLSLHFEGRIPSIESLIQASTLHVLDLLAPIGVVAQAIDDLEATLGKTLTGLSYDLLVDEIDLLIKRVSEERSGIRQLAHKQAALTASLAALDRLEPLTLQRCQWQGSVARLVHALTLHRNLLIYTPGQTLSDIKRLDTISNDLLRFEQHLLAQLMC